MTRAADAALAAPAKTRNHSDTATNERRPALIRQAAAAPRPVASRCRRPPPSAARARTPSAPPPRAPAGVLFSASVAKCRATTAFTRMLTRSLGPDPALRPDHEGPLERSNPTP